MDLSSRRLTAGELHWMLDPSVSSGRHRLESLATTTSSFPERLRLLQEECSLQDQQRIDDMNAEVETPTPLLADYEVISLKSRIEFPPDMAPYMRDFVEKLVGETEIMTHLKFQLPSPLFDNRAHYCLETFIPRHNIDLSTIAFDKQQPGRRLTLAQDENAFQELQMIGSYKRGDFHFTFSWYPGRDKIRTWRHQAWAECLYQWFVCLPLQVVSREQGILLGMWQFLSGVAITLNRLTGSVPSLFPKYTPSEVKDRLSTAYFRWLQDSKGFKLIGTEVIDFGRNIGESRVKRFPVIFEHPELGRLDFRTFIPHIRNRLERILAKERQAVAAKLVPQRMSIIAMHVPSLGEEGAIDRYLDIYHETYLEEIKSRRHEIDNLSSLPELTKTVLNEERTRYLVARIVSSNAKERGQKIENAMHKWKEAHAIMSCSDKFVDRQCSQYTSNIHKEVPLHGGVKEALLEAGLEDAALVMETQNEFEQTQASAELRQALTAARKPGVVDIVFWQVPSRWTVEEHQTFYGETCYKLEFVRSVQIGSSAPFWRLHALGVRYVSWIWNSSFFLVNQASIVLRRWNLFRESFDIRVPSVNHSTGKFDTVPVRTLRGRLVAILDWRRRILEKASTSEHIIRLREGLYLDICWAHFWTAMGVALGSASVVIYTICETVVGVAGAGLALVTSPVWSLLGNVGRHLFNALVHDCELDIGNNRRSPLFTHLFGIPNVVLSTVRGVFHLLKGTAVIAGGEARHVWNRFWHGLMTILLERAEVPTKAEGFFWSTSGPGMKTPFVLIDTDTAILALLAYLSQHELSAAQQEMYQDLSEPRCILA